MPSVGGERQGGDRVGVPAERGPLLAGGDIPDLDEPVQPPTRGCLPWAQSQAVDHVGVAFEGARAAPVAVSQSTIVLSSPAEASSAPSGE